MHEHDALVLKLMGALDDLVQMDMKFAAAVRTALLVIQERAFKHQSAHPIELWILIQNVHQCVRHVREFMPLDLLKKVAPVSTPLRDFLVALPQKLSF